MNEFDIEAAEDAEKEQEILVQDLSKMTDSQLIILMLGDLLHAMEHMNAKPNPHRLAVIREAHKRTTEIEDYTRGGMI